jgi:hypothetical protein
LVPGGAKILSAKTGKKSKPLRQAQHEAMKEFPELFYWAGCQLTSEP